MVLANYPLPDYATMVHLVIGTEAFTGLLSAMPDEFFARSQADQFSAWREMVRQVNRGERDPEALAQVVNVPVQDSSETGGRAEKPRNSHRMGEWRHE